MRALAWLSVLFFLLSFAAILVGIILVRYNWDDPDTTRREAAMIWLYVGAALVFIGGILAAFAAERTPDVCQLPYSGKLAEYKE